MNMKLFTGAALLIAGMTALPLNAASPAAKSCASGKVTPASYAWNFKSEAEQSIQQIQADAARAQAKAAQLEQFALNENIDFQVHAEDLQSIADDVNDIGQRLCRLQQIRRVLPPWEQKSIDKAAAVAPLLADNTTDAVIFTNSNQASFWRPAYRLYVSNLYQESRDLSRSLAKLEEFAKVHREDIHLEKTLGMNAHA